MEANESLWSGTAAGAVRRPALQGRDVETEVLIVGGGITGLTAALLLASEGRRVVLVEARRLGDGVSCRSTTHLTQAIDTRYFQIESDFGKEGAGLVAQSNRVAIEKVATIASEYAPDCGFVRRPGILFTERQDHVEMLDRELTAARRAGIGVERLARAPLPFENRGGVLFPNQAQMHVMRYLAGVASAAEEAGAKIHEGSRVLAIDDGAPCRVHLENGTTVRARHVFVATHAPLNRVFLQTKIAAYRSYVLAIPGVKLEPGLFWDTVDPYHYFSSYAVDGIDWLVVGGADHRTGTTTDTISPFTELGDWTRERLAAAVAGYRWSAQVEEPVDGLPFIGRNSADTNVFVATGFSGNGTTFGTIAAMMMADHVAGRTSPWAELYRATRVKPAASAGTYLKENIEFPIHLIGDYLQPPEAKSLDEIAPGEGKTVRVKGHRLAVYREPDGKLHAVSSVCTHLGCLVAFNPSARSWDCPCHGSRFSVDGEILDGPATRALEKHEL